MIFGSEQMLPARSRRMCVACQPAQVNRGLLLSLLARGTTPRAPPSRPKNAAAPTREPSTLESPRLSRLLSSEHRRASYQEPALSNMTGNMWSKELGCWRVSRTRSQADGCRGLFGALSMPRAAAVAHFPLTTTYNSPTRRQTAFLWRKFQWNGLKQFFNLTILILDILLLFILQTLFSHYLLPHIIWNFDRLT